MTKIMQMNVVRIANYIFNVQQQIDNYLNIIFLKRIQHIKE